jgi:beta-hydroxylase
MNLYFPNHYKLKNNWCIIREEAFNIYTSGKTGLIKTDLFFDTIADDGWKKFYIKWYGPILEEAYSLCPKTTKFIEEIPEIKLAMFSILEPGSIIKPHIGPFKGCVRYHLGLHCPRDAFININNSKYYWKNGIDVLFDDTYFHNVYNLSTEPRIILFCDIERKMIGPISQKINDFFINNFASLTTRINNKQEKDS